MVTYWVTWKSLLSVCLYTTKFDLRFKRTLLPLDAPFTAAVKCAFSQKLLTTVSQLVQVKLRCEFRVCKWFYRSCLGDIVIFICESLVFFQKWRFITTITGRQEGVNNILVKISAELELTADFPFPLAKLISFQFAEVFPPDALH